MKSMPDRPPASRPEPVFLYDADCGFCAASVRWLLRRGSRLDFRPCRQRPPEMDLAGLTAEDCRRAACLVESPEDAPLRVHRGAAAINLALRRLQGLRNVGWRLLSLLYLLPGLRRAEDAGYAWVARNRRRLGHSGGACSIR